MIQKKTMKRYFFFCILKMQNKREFFNRKILI